MYLGCGWGAIGESVMWMKTHKSRVVLPECCADRGVDTAVYSFNRAFRFAFAKKDGKTCLVPWDIDAWTALEFKNAPARERYFEDSMVADFVDDDDELAQFNTTP